MIIGVIGELGMGKTATATYLAHLAFMKGELVFSNYPLYFEHIPISHPAHLVFISEFVKDIKVNCKVILDEAWRWISSALSQSKVQIVLSHVYTRSRKEKWDIVYTTQRFRNVQVRLRHITDAIFMPIPLPYKAQVPELFKVGVTDTQGLLKGTPFTFKLEEVADLFDTEAECYGYEDMHKTYMEILAEKDLKDFAFGKIDKELEQEEQ